MLEKEEIRSIAISSCYNTKNIFRYTYLIVTFGLLIVCRTGQNILDGIILDQI